MMGVLATVLAILGISREVWDSLSKQDRERILTELKKRSYQKARAIAKAIAQKHKAKRKRQRK